MPTKQITEGGFWLLPRPNAPGMWVEYIAGKPRRILQVFNVDYYQSTGGWWVQIPDTAPKHAPPKDSQPA